MISLQSYFVDSLQNFSLLLLRAPCGIYCTCEISDFSLILSTFLPLPCLLFYEVININSSVSKFSPNWTVVFFLLLFVYSFLSILSYSLCISIMVYLKLLAVPHPFYYKNFQTYIKARRIIE